MDDDASMRLRHCESRFHSDPDVLPMTGVNLEIASGAGEHIVHFAKNFPALVFQPSDPEPGALLSAAA